MMIPATKDSREMGEDLIYYGPLRAIICRLHGIVINSADTAIKRHLRSKGHRSRGQKLTDVLHKLSGLSIADVKEIHRLQLKESSSKPVPHIRIQDGWKCTLCDDEFLTTSLELVQRHAGTVHGRERLGPIYWTAVKLQTLFSETKDRRYFVVTPTTLYQTLPPTPPSSVILSRVSSPFTITLKHPFAEIAERHAPLSSSRINHLLKSPAFKCASMPIFDDTLSNMDLHMKSVFPECDESPVWITAILYSTVQIMNRGAITTEGLRLQRRTIKLLNEKLTLRTAFCTAAVGAIMVLKATAYKTNDSNGLRIHSQGLSQILEYADKIDLELTPAARNALFWIDLGASAYGDDIVASPTPEIPKLVWPRELCPQFAQLPVGFQRNERRLPLLLLECVADLVEFQAGLESRTTDQLGRMQASIELRLLNLAQTTRVDPLAELVRLAVYICCYCSWMGTWNISILPVRLASKMMAIMEHPSGLFSRLVDADVDLLLWLLFICSSAVELDEGYVNDIRSRRDCFLASFAQESVCHKFNEEFDAVTDIAMGRALQNYVYVAGWVEQRRRHQSWISFEKTLSGAEG